MTANSKHVSDIQLYLISYVCLKKQKISWLEDKEGVKEML